MTRAWTRVCVVLHIVFNQIYCENVIEFKSVDENNNIKLCNVWLQMMEYQISYNLHMKIKKKKNMKTNTNCGNFILWFWVILR